MNFFFIRLMRLARRYLKIGRHLPFILSFCYFNNLSYIVYHGPANFPGRFI
uniref:Uncharacterized protein n=1 Tax=Rhizophora mucronata TaxID=61149 RepID=A0A2P2P893_RHIMU